MALISTLQDVNDHFCAKHFFVSTFRPTDDLTATLRPISACVLTIRTAFCPLAVAAVPSVRPLLIACLLYVVHTPNNLEPSFRPYYGVAKDQMSLMICVAVSNSSKQLSFPLVILLTVFRSPRKRYNYLVVQVTLLYGVRMRRMDSPSGYQRRGHTGVVASAFRLPPSPYRTGFGCLASSRVPIAPWTPWSSLASQFFPRNTHLRMIDRRRRSPAWVLWREP